MTFTILKIQFINLEERQKNPGKSCVSRIPYVWRNHF